MSQLQPPLEYRLNVAIVVLNDEGKILACRRSDEFKSWQLPQGGVEQGESIEAAMRRELEEEIGTSKVQVIGQLPYSIKYDWPAKEFHRGYRGQEQYYFLTRLEPGVHIDLSLATANEFDMFCWMELSEFLSQILGFKSEAYKTALGEFLSMFPGTIYHRT